MSGYPATMLSLAGTHFKVRGTQVTDAVKTTLAFKISEAILPNLLNISISDSTTWFQINTFYSTTSTIQPPSLPKASVGSRMGTENKIQNINSFRRQRQRLKAKGPEKGKGSKGSSHNLTESEGGIQGKGKDQVEKKKISGPLGHGIKIIIRIGRIKVIKRVTKRKMEKDGSTVKSAEGRSSSSSMLVESKSSARTTSANELTKSISECRGRCRNIS